jgi:hypothetical protein
MTVTILMMFFWIKLSCDWLAEASISKKHAVSIFRAEVMSQSPTVLAYHFSLEDRESVLF